MYFVVAPICHQVYRVKSERILTVETEKNKQEERITEKKRRRGEKVRERKGREEKTVMWVHNELLRIKTTPPSQSFRIRI
jgi:hypothetical protein